MTDILVSTIGISSGLVITVLIEILMMSKMDPNNADTRAEAGNLNATWRLIDYLKKGKLWTVLFIKIEVTEECNQVKMPMKAE